MIRTRALVAVLGTLCVLGLSACTPEQYQAWWTSQGNAPLAEPELSNAAASATAYWNEVARQNRFAWSSSAITPALRERMRSSWRDGCPVKLSALSYVRLSYMGFDGSERTGELVVNTAELANVVVAFKLIWDAGFPIQSMRLIDDYGGSDDASMAANNTSAFNCRRVAGTSTWSQHAYGTAIDINPVQNPYVRNGVADPPAGSTYRDRGNIRPGMLVSGGAGVDAFDRVGWGWGGRWAGAKDYQHVSANGR